MGYLIRTKYISSEFVGDQWPDPLKLDSSIKLFLWGFKMT